MFNRIVVGFDGHPPSHDALALAGRLAEDLSASLLVAYVSIEQPRWSRTQRDYQRELRAEVNAILQPALDALPPGITTGKASIASSSPARGLHDLAAEEHATLLILGSTHHGPVGRVLIGSAGELLLMGAPCSVVVAPRGYSERAEQQLGVIGVGFDGSPESSLAIKGAHLLATAMKRGLRAISVVPSRDRHHHEAQEALGQAIAGLQAGAEVESVVVSGDPVRSLSDAAAETDLLVVGSRGYGPLHHVLLGSVSAKLMRTAPSPLLVFPRSAATAEEELSAGLAAASSG